MQPIARGMRQIARTLIATRTELVVDGREHVPRDGACIIAARHYHHLYDGAALVAALPRAVRILVALDWVRSRRARFAMEGLCALARWPVVLRDNGYADASTVFAASDRRRYLAGALRACERVLRAGDVLVVFPQGRPVVDVGGERLPQADWLPFQPGFATLALAALRAGGCVPIVPAGFAYGDGRRPAIRLRFGEPVFVASAADRRRCAALVEQRVRALSQ